MSCPPEGFRINDRTMPFAALVPRFYNFCISHGFQRGRIMPSRAFCSDENQGYPVVLLTAHFGTFPFNHGRVGGVVATGRHGPHTHHGKDLVLMQASHVGYDPETGQFGVYRRRHFDDGPLTASCGKIGAILAKYAASFRFARENIFFTQLGDASAVVIDNRLTAPDPETGLVVRLERIARSVPGGGPEPVRCFSTSKAYPVHPDVKAQLPDSLWREDRRTPAGERLTSEMFCFVCESRGVPEGHDHLEHNLRPHMHRILTAPFPAVTAAQLNTRIEFDRTHHSIAGESAYRGRNLIFMAGLNIDVSPGPGQFFSPTLFVPWAACVQSSDGNLFVLEQDDLYAALTSQSTENPDRIDLHQAVRDLESAPVPRIRVDG